MPSALRIKELRDLNDNVMMSENNGAISFGLEVNANQPLGLALFSSDPTATRIGQLYYNTTTNSVKIYDGTSWIILYEVNIVKNGLILHWDMTDSSSYSGSGSTVYDISGNGYNGTIQGNPTYSTNNGGYMIFDGFGDYITSSLTAPSGARTLGFWVYYSSLTQPNAESFQLQGIQASGGYTYLGIADGGDLYYYIGTGTGGQFSSNIQSNTWYYKVITFDGSSFKIYLNGSEVQSGSASQGTSSATFQAAAINANHRLYGRGSEWQFYDRALSQSEVIQNFNIGKRRYAI